MRDRRREEERKERDVKDKRRFLNEAGGEESAHWFKHWYKVL